MKYDFKTVVDRTNTGARKWDQMYVLNPNIQAGTVPMSVADMEFKAAPEITEGLKKFIDESVFGYTVGYESFYQAVVNWMKRRHDWDIQADWIVNTSGVVPALSMAVRALSEVGDKILAFSPVYGPFRVVTENNQRLFTPIPLLNKNGHYEIDFQGFEREAQDSKSKVLLFCSPHNPVGRVWTQEELAQVIDIANRNNLYIVVDEIWHDIVFKDYQHHVFAKQENVNLDRIITCTAPSKSFNIAGLPVSSIIIPNQDLRQRFEEQVTQSFCGANNAISYKACELGYNQAEGWLDALLELIDKHQHLVADFFKAHCPQLKVNINEGTYVQWVDCSALNLSAEDLQEFMSQEAEFIVSSGIMFGDEGENFIRINLALPTHKLEENLNKLLKALTK